MLEYFPPSVATYWFNYSISNAASMGATLGDIADAVAPYRDYFKQHELIFAPTTQSPADHQPTASAEVPAEQAEIIFKGKDLWCNGWLAIAERLERQAENDLANGRKLSAGNKLLRASALVTTAEWTMPVGEGRLSAFNRSRDDLRRGCEHSGIEIDYVEIPYEGVTLDAMFVRGNGAPNRPAPTVLFLNGWHSSMDWYLQNGAVRELSRRGISSLLFDHPGSGSARFHKHLPMTPKTEIAAKAALDYLETRPDVSIDHVAAVGCSFGGYYVTRAAIFEKRINGCFVWGAFFNYPPEEVFKDGDPAKGAATVVEMADLDDLLWVTGTTSNQALLDVVKSITLEGIIDQLTCPLFIIQGRNDIQCPMIHATRTHDGAVNALWRELVVMEPEDGGDQHVQLDNLPTGLNLLCDRIAETIGGRTA